jgi:hypothetical protein
VLLSDLLLEEEESALAAATSLSRGGRVREWVVEGAKRICAVDVNAEGSRSLLSNTVTFTRSVDLLQTSEIWNPSPARFASSLQSSSVTDAVSIRDSDGLMTPPSPPSATSRGVHGMSTSLTLVAVVRSAT